MKREKNIRDRVLLISYIYMCECESVYAHVQVSRCVYIWRRLFTDEFHVYVCACDSVCVC